MLPSKSDSEVVWDPISRELRFQEVIFNNFRLEEANPYIDDVPFLESLYRYYAEIKERKICKKLKSRIVSLKKFSNAYTGFMN